MRSEFLNAPLLLNHTFALVKLTDISKYTYVEPLCYLPPKSNNDLLVMNRKKEGERDGKRVCNATQFKPQNIYSFFNSSEYSNNQYSIAK